MSEQMKKSELEVQSVPKKENSRRIAGKRENEIMDEFENYLIEYFKKNNLNVRDTIYLLEAATANIENYMERSFKWSSLNPPSQSHPSKLKLQLEKVLGAVGEGVPCPSAVGLPNTHGKCDDTDCVICWRQALEMVVEGEGMK